MKPEIAAPEAVEQGVELEVWAKEAANWSEECKDPSRDEVNRVKAFLSESKALNDAPLPWMILAGFRADAAAKSLRQQLAAKEWENAYLRDILEIAYRRGDEEAAIVDKIWKMFGTPSYESLQGRSIYDLIAEVQKRAESAEQQIATKERECLGRLAERSDEYQRRMRWFDTMRLKAEQRVRELESRPSEWNEAIEAAEKDMHAALEKLAMPNRTVTDWDKGYNTAIRHALDDTCDAADRLKRPSSAPAEMGDGWISVNERMPQYGDHILVYRAGAHKGTAKEFSILFHMRTAPDFTHWRPLPPAPAGEKDGGM